VRGDIRIALCFSLSVWENCLRGVDHLLVVDYLGVTANALVANPKEAQTIFTDVVEEYIPPGHLYDMQEKNAPGQQEVRDEIERLMQSWTFNDE